MAAYLMSYPPPSWHIRGADNFRSAGKPATGPRKAALEWLSLADAITEAGGQVLVMPPAPSEPPLTGMMYTANAGALFGHKYLVSRMMAAHRLAEAESIQAWLRDFAMDASRAEATWEGQAEITTLPDHSYLLSWGVRSDEASVDEVKKFLPEDAKTFVLKIREPFFHGDTCLSSMATPKGHVLLACQAALCDHTLADLADFVPDVDVIDVTEADALAYACNALSVSKSWLVPTGVSQDLLEQLRARQMHVVELGFEELFGKGGGGPRCLVNVMHDVDAPPHIRFDAMRGQLVETFADYPDSM